eukprot:Gb_27704 [translate_table: standard]
MIEARHGAIRKSMEEYISCKAAEWERLLTEVENNEHDMKKREIDADEYLKKATSELEEITKRYDGDIQLCSNELLRFVDIIAKHREHVESTISTVRTTIDETTKQLSGTFSKVPKRKWPRHLVSFSIAHEWLFE